MKRIPENKDRVVSRFILISELLRNLELKIELYLVKQITENTDRVLSRLILISVLLWNLEFKIECNLFSWLETMREEP